MNLRDKKVVLLAPCFFGYEQEIKNELEHLGAQVHFFDERPDNLFLTKVLVRLNFKKLITRKIDSYYFSIINSNTLLNADYLFIVAPEAICEHHLKEIKRVNPKIKIFSYYWDSIENKKSTNFLLDQSDKVFSFEKLDCEKFTQVRFLPLFYIQAYEEIRDSSEDSVYDVSFIGTAHSDRYLIVKSIVRTLNTKKVFLFFYSPSRLLFFIKKIIDKDSQVIPFRDIYFKSIAKIEILGIIKKSNCVIDIHHPNQTGLTMRSIEMLGSHKKLITTNENIRNYDFYKCNNIFIIDRKNPVIDSNFLGLKYEPVSKEIYEKYSLRSWLIKIFDDET